MSSGADLHVLYRIGNTPVLEYPYPHILVRDVFPADFYRELRENLPAPEAMQSLASLGRVTGTGYPARSVMPLKRENVEKLPPRQREFWMGVAGWLLGDAFGTMMIRKFAPWLQERLGDLSKVGFADEALILRDHTDFSLGPHTDSPSKVLAFLFYLPPDDSMARLGTSIYMPKDPAFVCPGGPHHKHADFRLMQTMPYLPNTLFAFMKTDNSFHGVEPIDEPNIRRDLLCYDIKRTQPAAPAPAVKFTF